MRLPRCPWRPPPSVVLTRSALAYSSFLRRRTACGVIPSLASSGVKGSYGRVVWEADMVTMNVAGSCALKDCCLDLRPSDCYVVVGREVAARVVARVAVAGLRPWVQVGWEAVARCRGVRVVAACRDKRLLLGRCRSARDSSGLRGCCSLGSSGCFARGSRRVAVDLVSSEFPA